MKKNFPKFRVKSVKKKDFAPNINRFSVLGNLVLQEQSVFCAQKKLFCSNSSSSFPEKSEFAKTFEVWVAIAPSVVPVHTTIQLFTVSWCLKQ